jgi:pimeloyl-ACP methyl ester carboxylesterase
MPASPSPRTTSPIAESATTLRVQEVDLEMRELGSGPALLYLHDQFAGTSDLPFLEALASRFRVLAPSHPGFSRSSLPERFDGVDDLAFFYLDLLDQLDLHDVTLAGASFGGWIAAEVAIRCCTRLRGLALIDPIGIKVSGPETRDIADFLALPPARVAELLYSSPPAPPDYRSMSDDELAAIARSREAFALFAWEPFAHNPKLRSRLRRITVPALILWGASDGIIARGYAEAYRDAIPGARLEVVEQAGHLPHRERPAAVAERLIAFAAGP